MQKKHCRCCPAKVIIFYANQPWHLLSELSKSGVDALHGWEVVRQLLEQCKRKWTKACFVTFFPISSESNVDKTKNIYLLSNGQVESPEGKKISNININSRSANMIPMPEMNNVLLGNSGWGSHFTITNSAGSVCVTTLFRFGDPITILLLDEFNWMAWKTSDVMSWLTHKCTKALQKIVHFHWNSDIKQISGTGLPWQRPQILSRYRRRFRL
jgi:hypothetical protein